MNAKTYAEGKTQEELLSELVAYQKKEVRFTRVATFANILLVIALIAALAVLLPRALPLLRHVERSLTEAEDMLDQASSMTKKAETLIDNMNEMVTGNTDAVTETVQKLNQIDFETLNQAIQNLDDVVRPLSEFVNRFSR